MPLPIVGPSYTLTTRKADVQRAVNLYLVGMETPGKAPFIMDSAPGLSLYLAMGAVVRCVFVAAGRFFAVAGSGLYEINSNGSTKRGTLSTSTGTVSMAYGLSQLVIVDGPAGYVLTLATNAFQQINSAGFYGSTRVRFLDNYFLFLHPKTQQFYISAINDATSEDPLDFASAESSPDNLVTLEVDHSELWLFGELTTEVWFNSGGADFPFQRNRSASIEIGCLAAESVQKIDSTIIWLGQDINGSGMVYRSNGFQALRISTQAIEQALQASTDLTAATAYCYQDRGLTFYCLNAPGLASTWVFEVSTGQWHERAELDSAGQLATPWRISCAVKAFGKRIGGAPDGNLYVLDPNVYTLAGDPLVRLRVTPHEAAQGRLLQFFSAFYLDCTTGEAGQGIDAQVEISWSKDSGASWSGWMPRSIGKVGERFARLVWRLLGSARDRVWRVRFLGNAPFSIVDGASDVDPGRN